MYRFIFAYEGIDQSCLLISPVNLFIICFTDLHFLIFLIALQSNSSHIYYSLLLTSTLSCYHISVSQGTLWTKRLQIVKWFEHWDEWLIESDNPNNLFHMISDHTFQYKFPKKLLFDNISVSEEPNELKGTTDFSWSAKNPQIYLKNHENLHKTLFLGKYFAYKDSSQLKPKNVPYLLWKIKQALKVAFLEMSSQTKAKISKRKAAYKSFICDPLSDLIPFVQLIKSEKHLWCHF